MQSEKSENKHILDNRLVISTFRTAGLVHEFKNIISNIKLNAEYGLSASENMEKNRSLKLVMNNTNTGLKSVLHNLEYFDFINRKNKEYINLKSFISDIIKILKLNYVNINFEYGISERILIKAYKIDVETIIFNIIRNSVNSIIKNKKDNGFVSINAYKNACTAVIEIKDNAGGIPFKVRSMLFAPPRCNKLKKGMGLYLSRKLAYKNNGTLDFYPIDNGSCFIIKFTDLIKQAQ